MLSTNETIERLEKRPESWGFRLDLLLVLMCAAAAVVPMVAWFLSRWIGVGVGLLAASVGFVFAIVILVTALTVPFPAIKRWLERVAKSGRDILKQRDKDLDGELLDGLWLPQQFRLLLWIAVPLMLLLGGLVALRWAPPTLHAQRAVQLERARQDAEGTKDRVGQLAYQQAIDKHSRKASTSPVTIVVGIPDQNSVSSAKSEKQPTPPLTTTPASDTEGILAQSASPTPIVIYYDADPAPDSTVTSTTTRSEQRNGRVWFLDLLGVPIAIPLFLLNELFGLGLGGDPEYELIATNVTQRIVEQQQLTPEELDLLLAKVRPENIEAAGNKLKEIVNSREQGDVSVRNTNIGAIDAAVARALQGVTVPGSDAHSQKIATRLAEMINQSSPAAVNEVFVELTSNLLSNSGGRFPSYEVRQKVLELLGNKVTDKNLLKTYVDKINEIDN